MSDTSAGDRAAFFLMGAAIGAAAALLMAPASGARTRRRLVRKGEEQATGTWFGLLAIRVASPC